MKKRVINLTGDAEPLLNIVSLARGRGPLTRAQRAHIARTVGRVPEVVVKVSGGARTLRGVETHLSYVGRDGELECETDDGPRPDLVQAISFPRAVVLDWDLDLEEHRPQDRRSIRGSRKPAKLVHNIIFSMPPGTSPDKLVKAVRKFVINEFALKHRYAFALHTDEPHPHVHLVVKAMNEQGERLNIRKATLRTWRQQFAEKLREQGVSANATERAVRGQSRMARSDRIFRVSQRGASWYGHLRDGQQRNGGGRENTVSDDRGRSKAERTRAEVVRGWQGVVTALENSGDAVLADRVREFALAAWRFRGPSRDQSAVRTNEMQPMAPKEPRDRTR